jgi:hypothetical protein
LIGLHPIEWSLKMSSTTQLSGGATMGASKFLSILLAVAFVAFIVTWLVHIGSAAQATLQQQRNTEMAAESRALCQKWGMSSGTEKFDECLVDIQTVRDRHAKRFMDDAEPL